MGYKRIKAISFLAGFPPFSPLPLYIMKVSMFNYSVLKGTIIIKGHVEFRNSMYRVLYCASVTK